MSSMTTTDNKAFLNELARLVGSSHLLTDPAKTARYRKGFRSGQGDALAVVFLGSLLELWRVLKACVTADKIILMQAANTGLTEGSTPNGNDYDRDVVIISTLRLDKLHVLGKGEQVLAYPGTTLYSLEKALKPLGREPHSVIGSSCIGASVIGGICNNSGGSLVQRGPAYTEMSLFARINEDGKLTLVNIWGLIWAKRRSRSLASWMMIASKMTMCVTMVVTPTIMTMSTAFVILKPTRPHVITPILIGYLNLLVAPESWRSLQYVLIPSKRKKISRCFISAPTSRKC